MEKEHSKDFERKKALVKALRNFYEPGCNKSDLLPNVFPVNSSFEPTNAEKIYLTCSAQRPAITEKEIMHPVWTKLSKRYHEQYCKLEKDFCDGKIDETEMNEKIKSALKHLQTNSVLEDRSKKFCYSLLSADQNWGTPNTKPLGVYQMANFLIKNKILYGF